MKKIISVFFITFSFITSIFAETITFQASSMSGNASDKNSRTILEGDAKVSTESMEISAQRIELSGKDYRIITASGNVQGKNLKSNLDFTCESMKYDRETKIATLENNVQLIDAQNEVNAQAQIIEYNQETELAIMQIDVSLTQKNNKCTSAYAVYKKNEQMLEMSGNPQIVQGEDTFRAQNISLNLKSQEITLSGRVKGSVTASSQTQNQAQTENLDLQTKNSSNLSETELQNQSENPSAESVENKNVEE